MKRAASARVSMLAFVLTAGCASAARGAVFRREEAALLLTCCTIGSG
ncbi:hypothetical protein LJ655_23890 [Paraburkholderia sp. MMS20-SJTN17]|uniref:Lipoprotein n=1 Tax=Paraburkholderia translucens TaxID=2886945 RepID=A0ABS8KKF8_9BURK|nr:hypothetical protein [Paraburkholderia sp. MMS20-SJTN17]MCC8404877.1 hypothetical protein [Paraburkholderia sp. MMS20-SJTN17]